MSWLKRVDKTWTALGLIVAIFLAGAGWAVDYWELRETVNDLQRAEASRTYWRIKAKMESRTADIYDLSEWCSAARVLGYDCNMKSARPRTGLISSAFAGDYILPVEKRDYLFFREAHARLIYWRKLRIKPGPFQLSRDRAIDRQRKLRYCRIARQLHADLSRKVPRQYRRPFRCPSEFAFNSKKSGR
jgi:hypothetical protein